MPGDRVEVRGPIGGYFVWDAAVHGGPLFLVAGGSGVVPLMAMLRHRARSGGAVPARLLYSSRTYEDVIYREELDRLAAATGSRSSTPSRAPSRRAGRGMRAASTPTRSAK